MRIPARLNSDSHGRGADTKIADTNGTKTIELGGIWVGPHGGDAILEGREETEEGGGSRLLVLA